MTATTRTTRTTDDTRGLCVISIHVEHTGLAEQVATTGPGIDGLTAFARPVIITESSRYVMISAAISIDCALDDRSL